MAGAETVVGLFPLSPTVNEGRLHHPGRVGLLHLGVHTPSPAEAGPRRSSLRGTPGAPNDPLGAQRETARRGGGRAPPTRVTTRGDRQERCAFQTRLFASINRIKRTKQILILDVQGCRQTMGGSHPRGSEAGVENTGSDLERQRGRFLPAMVRVQVPPGPPAPHASRPTVSPAELVRTDRVRLRHRSVHQGPELERQRRRLLPVA